MSDVESKTRGLLGHHHDSPPPPPPPGPPPPPPPEYGTFQGVPTYPPPIPPHQHHLRPAIGFPQPSPPPGAFGPSAPVGYQAVPGYAVAEGTPVRERRLPCCGIGLGWFLFIIGFFLAGIPWYVGALLLCCSRNADPREKPGYVGCIIAAILEIIAIILGVAKGVHH
ncbi:hypothetical protein Droror1_Dr00014028 [Drosera rotundifolia]